MEINFDKLTASDLEILREDNYPTKEDLQKALDSWREGTNFEQSVNNAIEMGYFKLKTHTSNVQADSQKSKNRDSADKENLEQTK
jgi:hypothetical protein